MPSSRTSISSRTTDPSNCNFSCAVGALPESVLGAQHGIRQVSGRALSVPRYGSSLQVDGVLSQLPSSAVGAAMKLQPAVRETPWPEIRNALVAFLWQRRSRLLRGTTEVDVTDSLASIRRIER